MFYYGDMCSLVKVADVVFVASQDGSDLYSAVIATMQYDG